MSNFLTGLGWLSLVPGKQPLKVSNFHVEVSNENTPASLDAVEGWEMGACAHQRGLTQQTAALAQAPQCHVEVSAATTPAGDLGESVGVQQFLWTERQLAGG